MSANPLPAIVLSETGEILAENEAIAPWLDQPVRSLLKELFADAPKFRQLSWEATATDNYLVKRIAAGQNEARTVHFTRIGLSAGVFIYGTVLPAEKRTRARFLWMLNAMASLVAEISEEGEIVFLNTRMHDFLGYHRPSPKQATDLLQIDSGALQGYLTEARDNGMATFSAPLRNGEGQLTPTEVAVVPNQLFSDSTYLLTASALPPRQDGPALSGEGHHPQPTGPDHLYSTPETPRVVYASKSFTNTVRQACEAAETEGHVLITGEAGTGKGLLARVVHESSPGASRAFVEVDCSVLSAEQIERKLFTRPGGKPPADGSPPPDRLRYPTAGTIFLDHVEELPVVLQTRLLRVVDADDEPVPGMEEVGTPGVRIIAASGRPLGDLVERGLFHADLLGRLGRTTIDVAPLRERRKDIYPLVQHFIEELNERYQTNVSGMDSSSLSLLAELPLPGNVTELRTRVKQAYLDTGDEDGVLHILRSDAPAAAPAPAPKKATEKPEFLPFEEFQRDYLRRVLDSTEGKVSGAGGAAEILQMNPQTLFSKLRKLNIER